MFIIIYYVNNILRVILKRYRSMVTSIQEEKDFNKLFLEELINSI